MNGEMSKELLERVESIPVYLVPLDKIRRSPVNPRVVKIDDPKVIGLAQTIKNTQLLNPVSVRRVEDGFELVAGERRMMAFQRLRAENPNTYGIPGFVLKLSDVEAHELTAIENMQREDLSPIEEASGIQVLIQERGYTLERVAEKLGKTVSWVAKRANLVKLTDKWREAIADPEHVYSRWTVGHLELVARYEANTQDEIFGEYNKTWNSQISVKLLRNNLEQYSRKLSAAAWKASEPGPAGTCACRQCDKRSGAQPHLFEEEVKAKKGDACLDPECWKRNAFAHLELKAAELATEYPEVVYFDKAGYRDRTLPDDSLFRKKAVDQWRFDDAKKGETGVIPALIIDGPGQGTVKWVKRQKQVNIGSSSQAQYDAEGNKLPKSLKERQEGLEKRRNKALLERAMVILEQEIAMPNGFLRLSLVKMLRFLRVSEIPWPWDYDRNGRLERKDVMEYINRPEGGPSDEAEAHTIQLMRRSLIHLKSETQGAINGYCNPDAAELTYWLTGRDIEQARREIKQEIPEPKAWAGLNEDGTPKRKSAV